MADQLVERDVVENGRAIVQVHGGLSEIRIGRDRFEFAAGFGVAGAEELDADVFGVEVDEAVDRPHVIRAELAARNGEYDKRMDMDILSYEVDKITDKAQCLNL